MFVELDGMGWSELVWFGSTWIESVSFWFQFTELLRPTFSTSKLFSCFSIFKNLLPLRFSLSLLIVTCHVKPLQERYDDLMTELKMLKLLAPIESGTMVTMGPCGFISVWLSILCLGVGTSVPLFNLPRGKWFMLLCTGMVAWLKWNMFVWILGSVWFYVWVMNGSTIPIECFTGSPI